MAALSTLSATALGMSALSGGMNALGAYTSARQTRDTLDYQAQLADINAGLSEQAAQAELQRGQREERSVRLRTAQLKSTQRTALAANGVDLGEGSARDILTSTDVMGEADANTAAANAVRAAWGYRVQGSNYQSEARVKRAQADGINPMFAASTSLLGSATNVAGMWGNMKRMGAGG